MDSRARPPCWAGATAGCLSRRRPAAEFACDRRSLSPACHWPQPDADTRARRSLCFLPLAAVSLLVSFLSHFWGWGGWGLRKCAQGRRPGRGSSVPGALARPPGPRVAGLPLAPRREGSGRGAASWSSGAVTPEDSGLARAETLRLPHIGFKSPGWGREGKPLPPSRSSPPILPLEVGVFVLFCFAFNRDSRAYFIHSPDTLSRDLCLC